MEHKVAVVTVPVHVHGESEPDLLKRIHRDVSAIADLLDARFLYLIKESARGTLAPDDVAAELTPLSRDLKRCFRRLVEVEERQDLSYRAVRELAEIDQHCVWLFRKIREQQALMRKLSLEAKLRGLIDAEAFNIYQDLLNLDEEERQFLESDDAQVRTLMLAKE